MTPLGRLLRGFNIIGRMACSNSKLERSLGTNLLSTDAGIIKFTVAFYSGDLDWKDSHKFLLSS